MAVVVEVVSPVTPKEPLRSPRVLTRTCVIDVCKTSRDVRQEEEFGQEIIWRK